MKKLVLLFFIAIFYQLQLDAQVLDTIWSRPFGGSANEIAYLVIPTSDNGYVVVGSSGSNDGDVSGQHGATDFWMVKLNSQGDTLWTKALGGTGAETATSVRQTSDNGFILSGYSNSSDGDVPGNKGGYDYWLVKLTQTGTISWSKKN